MYFSDEELVWLGTGSNHGATRGDCGDAAVATICIGPAEIVKAFGA